MKKIRFRVLQIWKVVRPVLVILKWKFLGLFLIRKMRNFRRAKRIAALDKYLSSTPRSEFTRSRRPVIRWIKGDGLDDEVTRAAICHATRLFGGEVDYCLITQGIGPERVREILSWAEESVEWWPITEDENPELAKILNDAGCPKEDFGYWWKWFPERVRKNAPEWILDGDMLVVSKPDWFELWKEGKDSIRITENPHEELYGEYSEFVDEDTKLYSGLISLPPNASYMEDILEFLRDRPLKKNHDGRTNPSEQGVIASVFQKKNIIPIPLHEFPFAIANASELNFGPSQLRNRVWGYHFARSFIMENRHFESMVTSEVVISKTNVDLVSKYQWLSGGVGQWGIPGYGMNSESLKILISHVQQLSPGKALELGTSRGRIAAVMSDLGFHVTTVDHIDRGAKINLKALNVEVVVDDAVNYLMNSSEKFRVIIVDVHDNSISTIRKIWRYLHSRIEVGGSIVFNNFNLADMEGWSSEKGVARLSDDLDDCWNVSVLSDTPPGIVLFQLTAGKEI